MIKKPPVRLAPGFFSRVAVYVVKETIRGIGLMSPLKKVDLNRFEFSCSQGEDGPARHLQE